MQVGLGGCWQQQAQQGLTIHAKSVLLPTPLPPLLLLLVLEAWATATLHLAVLAFELFHPQCNVLPLLSARHTPARRQGPWRCCRWRWRPRRQAARSQPVRFAQPAALPVAVSRQA